MRIPVEGHAYGGVPEEVLDKFRVDSSPEEQRGARVPEISSQRTQWYKGAGLTEQSGRQ